MKQAKSSLARRIFLTIFAIAAINVLVTLIAVEYIYEDMEDTILSLELAEERAFLERRIDAAEVRRWNSALLTAIYIPDGDRAELPALLSDRPVPFSAEVADGDKSYLISVERTTDPPGALYIAQDISLLEDREDFMQWAIALLCSGMLVLGLLLARHGTARVLRPLRELTHEIRRIEPGTTIDRLRGRGRPTHARTYPARGRRDAERRHRPAGAGTPLRHPRVGDLGFGLLPRRRDCGD